MIRWFFRVLAWIWQRCRWRKRRRAFKGVIQLDSSVDPASEMAAGKLVLIGPGEKPKWLRFKCPCGCGDVIALNLMVSHYPRWSVEIHKDGTLTAMPSVDAKTCGSHFWIRRNKVDWV
jgi:hypothetical protein